MGQWVSEWVRIIGYMYAQILQEGRADMQKELDLLKGRLDTEKKHFLGQVIAACDIISK